MLWTLSRGDSPLIVDVPHAGMLNAFYEQHFFYSMAARRKIKVACYSEETDPDRLWTYFKSMRRLGTAPEGCRYIHLWGEDAKMCLEVCEKLSDRLRDEYPDWHARVMSVAAGFTQSNICPIR